MYREHTQMSLKRERERQRAAQERDAEHAKLYFRPQISKGSQILARERSRERPVFERLWSPSRTKMNKNTYASSFSQTPVRNRRPSMSPPTEERRSRDTVYAHRHRDQRPASTTPEHLYEIYFFGAFF